MSEERHGSRYADKQAKDAAAEQAAKAKELENEKENAERQRLQEAMDAEKYSRYGKEREGSLNQKTVQKPDQKTVQKSDQKTDQKSDQKSDQKTDQKTDQEEKKPFLKKISWNRYKTAAVVVCVVLAAAYAGAGSYYRKHFYDKTEIFGLDCSHKTLEEVKAAVSEKLGTYQLTVSERDGAEEVLTAGQIGLSFKDDGSIDRMLEQQIAWAWLFLNGKEHVDNTSIGFSYEKDKTENAVMSLNCFREEQTVAPEDAFLEVTEEGYQIVPEIEGNTLDPEKTLAAVNEALDKGLETVSLEQEDCYEKPGRVSTDQDLVDEMNAKNAVTSARITMDFGDELVTVDPVRMDDWLVRLSDGSYAVDDLKVEEFVQELAEKYDTFGLPHTFTTAYETTLTLYDGDYGWLMDRDETLLELLQGINEGFRGELEPSYVYSAMHKGKDDIGDTYVEVCIEDQRMMLFSDGECIVDTPVVTGNPNRGNATPSGGVWAIDAKMENYTLVGQGYRVPVSFWMPFNGNVGIHDLKSRYYYGSTIYLTNGSHGCVNTPYEAVETIYHHVSIGTPVIVYKSPYEA